MSPAERRLDAWKIKMQQWRLSGKSVANWCEEQSISQPRFYYWKRKLDLDTCESSENSSFVELHDSMEGDSGIELHMNQFRIGLSREFDSIALKRCLQLLLEVQC